MAKNRLEAFSDGVIAIIITIMVLELKVPHGDSLGSLLPLFWLSLFPFATGWMGENHFAAMPSALYGLVLLMAAIAYWVLQQTIIAAEGPASVLKSAVGGDWKGKPSPLLYLIAIASTFWLQWIAQAIYVLVALLWLVPDRRIEHVLQQRET
jgi:uncharacterized membrane protein